MDKLLDLMPRLMTSKPAEVVKILQTMLRQSTFLHLPLPEQVRKWEDVSLIVLQDKPIQPVKTAYLGDLYQWWVKALPLIGSHLSTP